MHWCNTETKLRGYPEVAGSTNAQFGVWMKLNLYCCEQENGGHIRNCADWTEMQWAAACGVSAGDVQGDCKLWRWDMNTLCIAHYQIGHEREIARKRTAAKRTNTLRWHSKQAKQEKALASPKIMTIPAQ